MKVGASVYLDQYLDDRFTAAGAVWLARAEIGGDLACSGAQLGSNRDGIGLLAEGVKVGGQAFLREGFATDGAVRLLGADITGDLSCRAARLGSDHDGNALVADRMRVGGEVHLYRGFTASGAVVLNGADITGDLSLSGAQLTGTDHDGNALAADGMKAHHDVLLDSGPADDPGGRPPFTAAGAVRLARADITGQLSCSGAQLTGTDRDGNALAADGMRVGAAVLLDRGVHLRGNRVAQLRAGRPAGAEPGQSGRRKRDHLQPHRNRGSDRLRAAVGARRAILWAGQPGGHPRRRAGGHLDAGGRAGSRVLASRRAPSPERPHLWRAW